MKLRNKKTSEIGVINLKVYGDDSEYVYDKIETLYKEWEDIAPKEPLIIGKRFIDLFIHWATANSLVFTEHDKNAKQFVYRKNEDMIFYYGNDIDDNHDDDSYGIGFCEYSTLRKLEDSKVYSYYELVGEE